jgi:hypothetical protein
MNKLDIYSLYLLDFAYTFNKTRQTASDVIEREGGRPCYYSDASQKITSKLAEVMRMKSSRRMNLLTRGTSGLLLSCSNFQSLPRQLLIGSKKVLS